MNNLGRLIIKDNFAGSVEINDAYLQTGYRIAQASYMNNSTFEPGNSIGTTTFGSDLNITGNSTLAWETDLIIPASGSFAFDQIKLKVCSI